MVPDYEPTIPEWFHQQYELERFLAESRARFDAEEKTANRRQRRYFVGTAICWLAATLVFLALNARLPAEHNNGPLVPAEPLSFMQPSSAIPARSTAVIFIEAQNLRLPLLPEPNGMKQVLDQLGAIEVQGSLYTITGESYQGPLWVRKITRGEEIYLDEAALYEIDGPFRLRLPPASTVYIYASVPELTWNGGWGVPIQMPSSVHCNQPGICDLRLEELMFAATQR